MNDRERPGAKAERLAAELDELVQVTLAPAWSCSRP